MGESQGTYLRMGPQEPPLPGEIQPISCSLSSLGGTGGHYPNDVASQQGSYLDASAPRLLRHCSRSQPTLILGARAQGGRSRSTKNPGQRLRGIDAHSGQDSPRATPAPNHRLRPPASSRTATHGPPVSLSQKKGGEALPAPLTRSRRGVPLPARGDTFPCLVSRRHSRMGHDYLTTNACTGQRLPSHHPRLPRRASFMRRLASP